jgi:hypothetical protein
LFFLILLLQLRDEPQIGAFQILPHPLVDPLVQFRREMILPVSGFT